MKLTTARLKKLIREELEKMDEQASQELTLHEIYQTGPNYSIKFFMGGKAYRVKVKELDQMPSALTMARLLKEQEGLDVSRQDMQNVKYATNFEDAIKNLNNEIIKKELRERDPKIFK
jgi:hypothetical protein